MKNWKSLLVGELSVKRFAKSFLLLYTFLIGYVYFVSDSMMFLPQAASYADGDGILKITTDDGTRISAIHVDRPDVPYTILYSHGNSEDVGDIRPLLEDYAAQGYSVVAYDYHGYGTSGGKPSEEATYLDIAAVYRYLVETKRVSPKRIIAMGFSIGNGPTAYLAANHEVAAVVFNAPFLTAFRVLTYVPILPFDKFRNASRIRDIRKPVLVIHGTADDVIPPWHGQRLFELANEPKRSMWVEGAGHFNIIDMAGAQYWTVLREFVASLN